MRFVSPNEMLAAAKQQMLDGREPETQQDWQLVVNFIAFNTDRRCCMVATKFICKLYDIPLDETQIEAIVKYQLERSEK